MAQQDSPWLVESDKAGYRPTQESLRDERLARERRRERMKLARQRAREKDGINV